MKFILISIFVFATLMIKVAKAAELPVGLTKLKGLVEQTLPGYFEKKSGDFIEGNFYSGKRVGEPDVFGRISVEKNRALKITAIQNGAEANTLKGAEFHMPTEAEKAHDLKFEYSESPDQKNQTRATVFSNEVIGIQYGKSVLRTDYSYTFEPKEVFGQSWRSSRHETAYGPAYERKGLNSSSLGTYINKDGVLHIGKARPIDEKGHYESFGVDIPKADVDKLLGPGRTLIRAAPDSNQYNVELISVGTVVDAKGHPQVQLFSQKITVREPLKTDPPNLSEKLDWERVDEKTVALSAEETAKYAYTTKTYSTVHNNELKIGPDISKPANATID